MIVKIQIGKPLDNNYLYVEGDGYITKTHFVHDVAAFAMKFRTHCITDDCEVNKFHFVNWLNKYTDLHATSDIPVNGRIDL